MFGNDFDNSILQEDNDPKHRSRKCTHFKENNNIEILPWPSMSPDINPIENVWGLMKMKIARKWKSSLKSSTRLLQATWKELPLQLAENLVDSLPTRISMLIERKGDYIGY